MFLIGAVATVFSINLGTNLSQACKALERQYQRRESRSEGGFTSFSLHVPGLDVEIIHGTREPLPHINAVRTIQVFDFKFDPAHFGYGSQIRRVFGRRSLHYVRADIRDFNEGTHYRMGEIFSVWLPVVDVTRNDKDGPRVIISRDFGQVLFSPPDKEFDSVWGMTVGASVFNAKQKWGQQFYGKWKQVSDAEVEVVRARIAPADLGSLDRSSLFRSE
jgi:hypothetical protein